MSYSSLFVDLLFMSISKRRSKYHLALALVRCLCLVSDFALQPPKKNAASSMHEWRRWMMFWRYISNRLMKNTSLKGNVEILVKSAGGLLFDVSAISVPRDRRTGHQTSTMPYPWLWSNHHWKYKWLCHRRGFEQAHVLYIFWQGPR